MYGSIADLMANQPDFNRVKLRGGESPYRQPVMPGEQRLLPEMQQKLQPALPPVRKAANDLMEEYIAQVTPKNMGYGFESDMGGTFGGPDGVYIRGTSPDEQGYRERQFEQMKERMGNPFRGASRGMGEDTVAQLAPQNVRNVTAPSSMPYIKTPSEKRADEMLMQRLGNQLSPSDMRFFLEGNYGYSGV